MLVCLKVTFLPPTTILEAFVAMACLGMTLGRPRGVKTLSYIPTPTPPGVQMCKPSRNGTKRQDFGMRQLL